MNDGELQIQCARELARTHILHDVIKAIRYGSGFRSVLSASADTKHYYQSYDEIRELFGDVEMIHNRPFPSWEDNLEDNLTERRGKPPYYSSVMDASDVDFPMLSVPGKYDIAATRYLYFDQLETTDEKGVVNGYVTLNAGDKNIEQELSAGPVLFTDLDSNQSQKKIDKNRIIKYYVCGGKHRNESKPDEHGDDPFCSQWDYGRTPEEVMTNRIRSIEDGLMLHFRRYDSDTLDEKPFLKFLIAPPILKVAKLTRRWSVLRNQALRAAGKKVDDFSAFIDK